MYGKREVEKRWESRGPLPAWVWRRRRHPRPLLRVGSRRKRPPLHGGAPSERPPPTEEVHTWEGLDLSGGLQYLAGPYQSGLHRLKVFQTWEGLDLSDGLRQLVTHNLKVDEQIWQIFKKINKLFNFQIPIFKTFTNILASGHRFSMHFFVFIFRFRLFLKTYEQTLSKISWILFGSKWDWLTSEVPSRWPVTLMTSSIRPVIW